MNDSKALWHSLLDGPDSARLLGDIMEHVARGLSDMVGQAVCNDPPQVKTVHFTQVSACVCTPEAETVGVYLELEHGLRGWAVLLLPLDLALRVAEQVTGAQPNSVTRLGLEERSALAEVGNLTLSYFLNAVAELTGRPDVLLPSPPAVVVDMMAAILDLVITPAAAFRDELTVIEMLFRDSASSVQACFWVLPDL
ncbi:MAG: chemotaxis protein CheC [Thermoflexales bacterium]|nr:chemotaxis protein CheC [Thermoflexales bacterium]